MIESGPEGTPNIENKITKESVIESLRKNPEDLESLKSYIDSRQKLIQAPYVSREDVEIRSLEFNIKLAEIYRDAGLTDAAADAYNDAADMAQASGIDEKYQEILTELAKL